ncbi:RICIN domain-containing protein [Sorangium sp. So ce302]|uniref:RICIN domain-containing protein n=1 Tax=unclassified Sorangium TaxID=2621164 RepID=UPI003F61C5CC
MMTAIKGALLITLAASMAACDAARQADAEATEVAAFAATTPEYGQEEWATACDHLKVTAVWSGLCEHKTKENTCTYNPPPGWVIVETKTEKFNDNHGSFVPKTLAGGSRLILESELTEAYDTAIDLAVKWRNFDAEAKLRERYNQHSSERQFYEASHNTFVGTVSATPWGSCADRKGAWIDVSVYARLRYIGEPGKKHQLLYQLEDKFGLVPVWIGITRSDRSNAIYAMDGSDNPRSEVVPWKTCPEGQVQIGLGVHSTEEAFWVCTAPAQAHDTFFVSRFVNAAAFVYRVRDGSVQRMGGIEYQNCPMLSTPIGRALIPGGFWACSGGGISPPPVAMSERAPALMVGSNPSSTAQQWFFDPIGSSPSRAPTSLAASKAGTMIVSRATGMALDHSGSAHIRSAWIAIVDPYTWSAKGQVWLLEKHPSLDRYVLRWPPTGQVLDYAFGEDGKTYAVLQDAVAGAPAQLWDIRHVEGDYYAIVNHHSGQALSL